MASFWVPDRVDEPELMDEAGLPPAEVEDAYRILRRVNRHLGNLQTIRREFRRFLRDDVAGRPAITTLDLGSGSGDIPLALSSLVPHGQAARMIAIDRDPTAVLAASRQGLPVVRGDALRLPFEDRSVDLVLAVKFAHHFAGDSLTRLIEEMARVASHRVLILDIRRHWLAYWGFRAWSRVFTTNRLVRFDGPLSVLRGFTAAELLAEAARVPGFSWEIRRYLGFQIALIGRRCD